ncbi:xanthine dehydrogenase family protein molybdopterin-binding subunit [Azohydromonas australica]|uniref:xanthine dehydrogenase family protein molybdopterin-binding subunit n=1 Tax=Azohydromonas australica TaxID=364039 RepID=UPI00146BA7A2|nr:molybdopterin cofactor-binding domain-containing protein [Azohydromonas australica]
MALGITWSAEASAAVGSVNPQPWGGQPRAANTTEYSPWLTIGRDGLVTVRVTAPDLGNGVMTQQLMTVAEELYCDWNKLRAEYAPANRNFVEGHVYSKEIGYLTYFGRSTAPKRMEILLQVAASARERLMAAAARTWGVPRSELQVRDGVITHVSSRRKASFGELAETAATIQLDAEPTPKPHKDWWFLGKASPIKVQQPQIVTGKAVYGIDVTLPDMVYAALMQSPVQGGKLKSYDFEKVRGMPGVLGVAVVDPTEPRPQVDPKLLPFPVGQSAPQSAIAVIAEHYWQARKALEAMPVQWDDGPGAQWKTQDQIDKALNSAIEQEGEKTEVSRGNALEALEKSARTVEAVYHAPFADHVTMEPLNGTALVTPERVDVWHPTQQAQQGHMIAAQETGVPPEKVFIHQTFVGGGFGRRAYGNDLRMVVAVAKKYPGRPVKVIWSREETMRQGRYRPIETVKLRAGLDSNGLPSAFHVRVAGSPGFYVRYLSDGPLSSGLVDNVQVESRVVPLHVMGGPYRGPGMNVNAFATETFIDECAVAAGVDPLEYRLKLFSKWPDPGWTQCLKEVATKAKWGRKLPVGWGQGIAIANWGMGGKPQAGVTLAAVVTVEVSKQGLVRVDSIDIALDPGRVGYPDGIVSQMEGGAIFALNSALNERLTVQDGRIVEGNYHEYPMLRIADAPRRINVHFGGVSGHERMAEIGESPMGAVPPALGNAIFAATGKRLRSMPFRMHDLSWS